MAGPPSDADLVSLAQSGSRPAFDQLVERYWRAAVATAFKRTRQTSDAEDVAQDAFVLAYRKLRQLREPERFAGWFFVIVARTAVEWARRKPRRPQPQELVEPEPGPRTDRADRADRSVLAAEIQRAIDALPDRYRPVVLLRYGQGMAVKDVAAALDLPRGTVVSQIFRANRILRTHLGHLVNKQ